MRRIVNAVLLVAMLIFAPATASWAAVTPYSQDFESMALPSPGALLGDSWLVYGNVYDSGVWQYGYGPYQAPNDGAAFCAIASGEGGPSQGSQQLSVYSDYNNGDHGNGFLIETNVYQEQSIEAADVGNIVTFTFDAKLGNLGGSSEGEAFIKTLDPGSGWATTNHITENTTVIPSTWGTYSLELTIDGGLVGQVLQFGFTTRATNYDPSGVFYDNVNVQASPPPSTVTLEKSSIVIDRDASGTVTAGDSLLYTIVATNNSAGDALDVVIDDTPDANTTLTVGTATTTQGTIVSGNTAGDTAVSADVGTLSAGASVTVTFEVMINDPLPVGVTEVSNQAFLAGSNVSTVSSNTTFDVIGTVLQVQRPVPTLSTWSIVIFSLLLAGAALWRLRS